MQCRSETYKQQNVYQMHLEHTHKHVQAHSLCMTNTHVCGTIYAAIFTCIIIVFIIIIIILFFYCFFLGGDGIFFLSSRYSSVQCKSPHICEWPIIILQNAYIF